MLTHRLHSQNSLNAQDTRSALQHTSQAVRGLGVLSAAAALLASACSGAPLDEGAWSGEEALTHEEGARGLETQEGEGAETTELGSASQPLSFAPCPTGDFRLPPPCGPEPGFDLGDPSLPRVFADVTGDGRDDFCRFTGHGDNLRLQCAVAERGGFGQREVSSIYGIDAGYDDHMRQFGDVNGDGYDDFCRVVGRTKQRHLSCLLGSPLGFSHQYAYNSTLEPDFGYSNEVRSLIDANGDGRADYCRVVGRSSARFMSCMLAGRHGFGGKYGYNSSVEPDFGYKSEPRSFIDVNRDGYGDYCRVVGPRNHTFLACMLGSAHGFGSTHAYRSDAGVDLGYRSLPRAFVDANGDGYGDYCRVVGPRHDVFVSCALGAPGGFDELFGYNSHRDFELGRPQLSESFADVTGDRRADMCRVLLDVHGYEKLSCARATPGGYSSRRPYESR